MLSKKISKKYNPKIVIAMSGGVDSSVAAAMLKKSGYDVIGIFLKFWKPSLDRTRTNTENTNTNKHELCENICCDQEALFSARKVAEKLKIPFYVLDASKEFKNKIVDYYISEYESGRTPNPCVMCNKYIKFGWLLEKARELGAEFLATGHYARVSPDPHLRGLPPSYVATLLSPQTGETKTIRLLKAKDKKKDQSYFLWQLSQDQLKHIVFPLGDYTKPEVRELARKWHLETAEKKESQNVCFIPDGNNFKFMAKYSKKLIKKGKIIDSSGKVLGVHRGLLSYTIGQRKGINVQLNSGASFVPAYVIKLNIKKNELVVGKEKNLYSKELVAVNVNWLNPRYDLCKSLKAKIRYGHKEADCQITKSSCNKNNNAIKIIFDKPQRAITPGQSIVLYCGEELLGGGIIE
jgi:tRNA-specific 2-thiouridylase